MSSTSSLRRASARRALIADISADRKGWLQHGVAALAISLLGLGVAASVALTGSAHGRTTNVATVAEPSVAQPSVAVAPDTSPNPKLAPRGSSAGAGDANRLKSLAEQRAEELSEASEDYAVAASTTSAEKRDKALKDQAAEARKAAKRLAEQRTARANGSGSDVDVSAIQGNGKACLPVASYRIAARFGQVGIWSRYHTGIDFSAPIGTPLRAPSAGVVVNAGIGPASGWAGNYVAIKYPDGTYTLHAHMSTVSVGVGQTVSACQLVGAIGMTGRTFGPHVHFEVYPSEPGSNPYQAVNPQPWLNARGLQP